MELKEMDYSKLFALTAVVIVVIFVLTYALSMEWASLGDSLESTARQFGLPGLFFASIIANATIFLPVPIDFVVFLFGKADLYGLGVFTPLAMALVVALGAAIGEFSGYLIGLFGVKSVEKMKREEIKQIVKKENEINKYGGLVVFFGALTPFPFDMIGIASGLIKFDAHKFFIACFLGKLLRYIIIAYAGMYSIDYLLGFFGG